MNIDQTNGSKAQLNCFVLKKKEYLRRLYNIKFIINKFQICYFAFIQEYLSKNLNL